MFPVEIWEIIFTDIDDTIILARLQLVCKSWYHVIKRLLPKSAKWRGMSSQRIPVFWIEPILYKKCPQVFQLSQIMLEDPYKNVPTEVWQYIYISWKKYQKSMQLPRSIVAGTHDKLLKFTDTEKITCMHVKADLVAFATTEGMIYFSHYRDLKCPFFIANHGGLVTEIRIWLANDYCTDKMHLLAASTSEDGQMKYWNFETRKELPGGHLGRLLTIDYCHLNTRCFSAWGNSLFQCTAKSRCDTSTWKYEIIQNRYDAEIVAISMNCEKLLTFNGKRRETRVYDVYRTSYWDDFVEISSNRVRRLPVQLASCTVKKFHMFSEDFVACVTDRWLGLSVANRRWVVHDILKQLGGNIRIICLINTKTRLMLALDSGDNYIFTVRNEYEWKNFDFTPENGVKLSFSKGPVVSIGFMTMARNFQYIIVATENAIQLYK